MKKTTITNLEEFITKKEKEEKELNTEMAAELEATTEDDIKLMKELGIYPEFDAAAAINSKAGVKGENKLIDRYNENEASKMDDFLDNAAAIASDAKKVGLFSGMKFNN